MCHDASCGGTISNDARFPGNVLSGPIKSCAALLMLNNRKKVKSMVLIIVLE